VKIPAAASALRQLERNVRRVGIDAGTSGPDWAPPGMREFDLKLFDRDELAEFDRLLERLEENAGDEEARARCVALLTVTQARREPPPWRPVPPPASSAEAMREEVTLELAVRSDPTVQRCGPMVLRLAFDPHEVPEPERPVADAVEAVAPPGGGEAGDPSPESATEAERASEAEAAAAVEEASAEAPRRRYADPSDPVLYRRRRRDGPLDEVF
jgi:hypothetical protein